MRIAALIAPLPKIFYGSHGYYGMGKRGGPKEFFYNLVERMLGHVGITINSSEDERLYAMEKLHIPSSRIRVIHNGVDTDRFAPPLPGEKVSARSLMGLPLNGKILLTIGRVSVQKNLEALYDVLNEMLPNSDWAFCHAGAGSTVLRSYLSPEAAQRCHAFEHLNDVVPLLHASDGFVMTSRYEGLSLTMLEAMSCGIPCLLTDAMGFRFLKQQRFHEIIWLSNPDSEEELKNSLKKSLSAWSAVPSQILTEQREIICERFNQHRQISEYISLFEECSTNS